jgi:hypothetical protein
MAIAIPVAGSQPTARSALMDDRSIFLDPRLQLRSGRGAPHFFKFETLLLVYLVRRGDSKLVARVRVLHAVQNFVHEMLAYISSPYHVQRGWFP